MEILVLRFFELWISIKKIIIIYASESFTARRGKSKRRPAKKIAFFRSRRRSFFRVRNSRCTSIFFFLSFRAFKSFIIQKRRFFGTKVIAKMSQLARALQQLRSASPDIKIHSHFARFLFFSFGICSSFRVIAAGCEKMCASKWVSEKAWNKKKITRDERLENQRLAPTTYNHHLFIFNEFVSSVALTFYVICD